MMPVESILYSREAQPLVAVVMTEIVSCTYDGMIYSSSMTQLDGHEVAGAR
jgi:hypothetical protein